MVLAKIFKKNILPLMLSGVLILSLIVSCIPVLSAQTYTSAVMQSTGAQAEQFKSFVEGNVANNLLAGITPSVSEENTSIGVSNTASGWENLTDGNYSTRKTLFPTGKGNGVLRYTYTLADSISISDILVVCREDNTSMYALEYEVYVSESFDNLYTDDSRVFVKTDSQYSAGGQRVTFTEEKPVGKYIGFRLTNAKNKYHLGELGVYGTKVESDITVKQTTSNSDDVTAFISGNLENNLLKGLTPAVAEEGTTVGVNDIVNGWDAVTDGSYATSKIIFPTGLGNGVLRYTYSLPYRAEVSDLMLVCRENNIGTFALQYEIYVSENLSSLYNAENLVFKKTSGNYTEGGQLISIAEKSRPTGGYIGFRLVDAENKYHVSELGVYGKELEALPEVKQTDTNSAEFISFMNSNKDKNIVSGLIPSVIEEETSMDVYGTESGWEAVSDCDYATSKIIFPTGRGNGVLRYTYSLPYCMEISNLLMVCRENNTGTFALEYEIYVSSTAEDLYTEKTLIFSKTFTNYTEGGQLLTLPKGKLPSGYFVGIRLANAVNKYHVAEIGIYGERIEDTVPYITQHTLTDLPAIKAQINKDNLLKGIIPSLYDCEVPEMPWKAEFDNSAACNWIACNGEWDLLTDGELFTTTLENKRRVDIMQGKRQGGLVLTYILNEATVIDKIVMVGMWGGFGDYCTQEYKLYISDTLDDLYDGSNLILTYNNEDRFNPNQQYSGAGQMFTFNNKPSGKYFGIKFTDENNTDVMVRLEEIGIFGTEIQDEKVNILDNKLCDIYLSDDSETKLNNQLIDAQNRLLLADGSSDEEVVIESSGKKVEFVYDLCKEMSIEGVSLTTAGDSLIKGYKVYAASQAEKVYDSEYEIASYKNENNTSKTAAISLDNPAKVRYIRIVIDDYSGTNLKLAEVSAIGSMLENLKVKDIVNDINEENISAWLTDETVLEKNALIDENASLTALTDNNKETAVQLYGASENQTIDILYKLPNLKLIQGFEYLSGTDTLPKQVKYYVGETETDVFDKDATPVVTYNYTEGDDLSHSLECIPTIGLYVRVSVTATEKAADESLAATIAQLRVKGFYIEGFIDESGDKTVLKSFRDEENGISVKISKLYSNDIWSKIVRMSIKKRQPKESEASSLASLGLKVYDSVLDICFYDSENNRITDLGGREMKINFKIPAEESVAYMAQCDDDEIWILNASYEGDEILYTLSADEITFLFALAVEDMTVVDNYYPEETPQNPDDNANDGNQDSDFEDLPIWDETVEGDNEEITDIKMSAEWETKIGKGKLTKAVISKLVEKVHPAVWYGLIAAVAVEILLAVLFIVIKLYKKNNKRRNVR